MSNYLGLFQTLVAGSSSNKFELNTEFGDSRAKLRSTICYSFMDLFVDREITVSIQGCYAPAHNGLQHSNVCLSVHICLSLCHMYLAQNGSLIGNPMLEVKPTGRKWPQHRFAGAISIIQLYGKLSARSAHWAALSSRSQPSCIRTRGAYSTDSATYPMIRNFSVHRLLIIPFCTANKKMKSGQ